MDEKVILKYLGQYGERWSCVPARDLTQEDLKRIAAHPMRGPSKEDILLAAKTCEGEPLYMEVEEIPEKTEGEAQGPAKPQAQKRKRAQKKKTTAKEVTKLEMEVTENGSDT